MKTRLQQFLQAENLSPSQFADRIGIQRSGVSHVLAGRNKPGFDFMESMLLSYPSLNAEWLMTGKGKMYKDMKQEDLQEIQRSMEKQEQPPVPGTVQQEGLFANIEPLSHSPAKPYHTPSEEEHKLIKVLLFYSDNTFSEFFPNEQ